MTDILADPMAVEELCPMYRQHLGDLVWRRNGRVYGFRMDDILAAACHLGALGNGSAWLELPPYRMYRALLNALFSVKAVASWKPAVRQLCVELLDEIGNATEIEVCS